MKPEETNIALAGKLAVDGFIKASAMPAVADAIRAAVLEEREACAKVADAMKGGKSHIGPLHGVGWNHAAKIIAERIRARSVEA